MAIVYNFIFQVYQGTNQRKSQNVHADVGRGKQPQLQRRGRKQSK